MEHESDADTNFIWSAWNGLQRLGKGAERVRNRRQSRDHLSYRIVKIGQNTDKSPRELWSLVVTQTPVKDYQLTLARKNLQGLI